MKKRLILHIGVHKTGTTALQKYLFENREKLYKERVYYPDQVPTNHSISFAPLFIEYGEHDFYHFKKYYDLNTEQDIKNKQSKLEKYWIDQFVFFHNSDCDTFIISAESLEYFNERSISQMHEFVNNYFDSVKISIYFREPVSQLSSAIQQAIKSGILSLENYQQYKDWTFSNYKDMLKNYSAYFGKDNLMIKVYDRQKLLNHSIINDFLYCVLNVDTKDIINKQSNSFLGYNATLLLSVYNKYFPSLLESNAINKQRANGFLGFIFEKVPDTKKESLKIDLDLQDVKRINDIYKDINEYLPDESKFNEIKPVEGIDYSLSGVSEEYLMNLLNYLFSDFFAKNKRIGVLNEKLKSIYRSHKKNIFKKLKLYLLSFSNPALYSFDVDYYKNKYPQVSDHYFRHYLLHGSYEGLNPNENFDTSDYIINNIDIVISGENPLVHYRKNAKKQIPMGDL